MVPHVRVEDEFSGSGCPSCPLEDEKSVSMALTRSWAIIHGQFYNVMGNFTWAILQYLRKIMPMSDYGVNASISTKGFNLSF